MKDKFKEHARWVYKESNKTVSFEDDMIERVDCEDIMLYFANLSNAEIMQCSFPFGNFRNSYIQYAEFIGSDLSNTNFSNAQGEEVKFWANDMKQSRFDDAFIKNSVFDRCDLVGANFKECMLWGTKFKDCDLRYVDFTECEMTNVEFINCKLENAKFTYNFWTMKVLSAATTNKNKESEDK